MTQKPGADANLAPGFSFMDEHKISLSGGPHYFITLNFLDSYLYRHWWCLAALVGVLTLVVSAMVDF